MIKASKNFKNVSYTCASRHELAQICHKYYGLFPTNKFEIPAEAVTLSDYQEGMECSSVAMACEKFNKDSLILNKVKVYGTTYKPGKAVVLKKESIGELSVGLIKIMVFFENKLYFLCKCLQMMQSNHNFYLSQGVTAENVWVLQDQLLDYYPLTCYGSPPNLRLVLHHFISEK